MKRSTIKFGPKDDHLSLDRLHNRKNPLQYDSSRGVISFRNYLIDFEGNIQGEIPEEMIVGFDVDNAVIIGQNKDKKSITVHQHHNESGQWKQQTIPQNSHMTCAYDKDKQIMIVPFKRTLQVIDLKGGIEKSVQMLTLTKEHELFQIYDIAYDPFSRICLAYDCHTLRNDSILKICDMEKLTCLATYRLKDELIRDIQYDAASRMAVVFSGRLYAGTTPNDLLPYYGALSLWDMENGRHLRDFYPDDDFEVTGFEWDPKLHTVLIHARNLKLKKIVKVMKYIYK